MPYESVNSIPLGFLEYQTKQASPYITEGETYFHKQLPHCYYDLSRVGRILPNANEVKQ